MTIIGECAYCDSAAVELCHGCSAPLCSSCGDVDDDRRFCPECDNREPYDEGDYEDGFPSKRVR